MPSRNAGIPAATTDGRSRAAGRESALRTALVERRAPRLGGAALRVSGADCRRQGPDGQVPCLALRKAGDRARVARHRGARRDLLSGPGATSHIGPTPKARGRIRAVWRSSAWVACPARPGRLAGVYRFPSRWSERRGGEGVAKVPQSSAPWRSPGNGSRVRDRRGAAEAGCSSCLDRRGETALRTRGDRGRSTRAGHGRCAGGPTDLNSTVVGDVSGFARHRPGSLAGPVGCNRTTLLGYAGQ
jgi:hypothetical protein